jgi:hypothetical protein
MQHQNLTDRLAKLWWSPCMRLPEQHDYRHLMRHDMSHRPLLLLITQLKGHMNRQRIGTHMKNLHFSRRKLIQSGVATSMYASKPLAVTL